MTPLRFAGGSRFEVRRGQTWTIERVHDGDGREMLYLLRFFLPRFLDHPLEEKLTTVFHELWHIGPEFDGDLRRHEGRCWAHSASQAQFDAGARRLADAWLAQDPPKELYAFLQMSFEQLQAAHGRVIGLSVRPPRLVRVPQPAAADRA